jgi:hypothetical protein
MKKPCAGCLAKVIPGIRNGIDSFRPVFSGWSNH